MSKTMLRVAVCAAIALSARTAAAAPLQRFTLVIGANAGGTDRVRLQYAVSDAERFARVMTDLGGVTPDNAIVLKQPNLRDLIDAFDRLKARVAAARRAAAPGGRTEVVVYYSGHADGQGLLIGDDRYSYRTLRDRLDEIPADVRIAVLDACASGAFTRLKGGRARPAFLVDESTTTRGHAFLTSSAETESAQESDRIRASYFTHFLVSGFRGAADISGDGRVTLNEAYQFAFAETLGRTVDTKGGAQHPSYDINLSGTGDVVMTDVRQTTAVLVLGEELEGRFFVRNAAQELVVEVFKPKGRRIELGVEPGAYQVRLEVAKASMTAKAQVADGARVALDARQFGPAVLDATTRRGDNEAPRFAVRGRDRVEMRWGRWKTPATSSSADRTVVDADNALSGVQFTHFLRENVAVTFGFSAVEGSSVVRRDVERQFTVGDAGVVVVPIGVRWWPSRWSSTPSRMKPYLTVGVGPAIGHFSGTISSVLPTAIGVSIPSSTLVLPLEERQTTFDVSVGGGVDYHVFRSLSFGIDATYNWIPDFDRPLGPAGSSMRGPSIGLTAGWLFGRTAR